MTLSSENHMALNHPIDCGCDACEAIERELGAEADRLEEEARREAAKYISPTDRRILAARDAKPH